MGGRRADVVDVTAEYYIAVYINTYPYNFLEYPKKARIP
jgi:hypothetical protein